MNEEDPPPGRAVQSVQCEPPLEPKAPRTTKPQSVAGGAAALLSSLKHSLGEMGVTRTTRTLLDLNQMDGFDCPGCAWPDPDHHRAKFEFCENGVKAVAEEATKSRVSPEFFAKHSLSALSQESDHWLGKRGRITHPMWLKPGADRYKPISWKDAFRLIADRLNALRSPNEAIFYTSGRTSNEAAFLYQLFVRIFGTNNLPDCSNMCHESSGVGLKEVIGVGKGTVTLDDFSHADCVLVIGQNPGTNHPRMLATLQEAARRGAQIVSINPLHEAGTRSFAHPKEMQGLLGIGTPLANQHLAVKINGDVALLKGLAKWTVEQGSLDAEFISEHTIGFLEFERDLRALNWDRIEQLSGVAREQIESVAEIIDRSKSVICCWAMGLTQHENAVANIQSIVNLLALGGHFGRPGAGVCPVRGHSNVQGDRTVGICERPSAAFLAGLEREFKFSPPKEHGYHTVSAIEAMQSGAAKVFFAMGGNFLSATPDTEYTAQALRNCELTVQVSTKLNRSHLITGSEAIILPCLGRTEIDLRDGQEQFVTVENSMGIVHRSKGGLPSAGTELRSEVWIVAELAKEVFATQPEKLRLVDWERLSGNYDLIRDHIAGSVGGFEDYNARVREPGGFYLPNPVRDERRFETGDGKLLFTVHEEKETVLAEDQFLMMTIRSHDQYNTTIYGLEDRYRGISGGRRVVLMNEGDISREGLCSGELVSLTSHYLGKTREARGFRVVPYPIPERCLATYFPEANVLVPIESYADKSFTPASKSVVVSVQKENQID